MGGGGGSCLFAVEEIKREVNYKTKGKPKAGGSIACGERDNDDDDGGGGDDDDDDDDEEENDED